MTEVEDLEIFTVSFSTVLPLCFLLDVSALPEQEKRGFQVRNDRTSSKYLVHQKCFTRSKHHVGISKRTLKPCFTKCSPSFSYASLASVLMFPRREGIMC